MARLGINTGSNPNDGQGDPLRIAMGKINSNFDEIYSTFGDGSDLDSIPDVAENLTGNPIINVSGILNVGVTTTEHIEVRNITSTGIVTAVQFVGDGSQLSNVTALVAGLEVLDDNIRRGIARELNFGDNIITTGPDGVGRVTIAATGSNASPQFVTTSAGIHTLSNVGIGTTNPTEKLTVSGTVQATSFVGEGSGLTGVVGTGSGVEIRENGSAVGTAATINFRSNLEVSFASGVADIDVITGIATDSEKLDGELPSYYLDYDNFTNTPSNLSDFNNDVGFITTFTDTNYWTKTSAGIHTLSNVGIGTTNPTEKLTVVGDARVTGILTVGSASITLNGATNTINVGSGVTINGSTGTINATSINLGGTILTGGESYWVETSAGIHTLSNVGIGTTNPISTLTVGGDVLVSDKIVAGLTSSIIPFYWENFDDLPSFSDYHGAFAHVHETGKAYYAHARWIELVNTEIDGSVGTGTENYNVGVVTANFFYGDGSGLTNLPSYASTSYVDSALVGYATEGYVTTQIGLNTFTGAASTITSGQISNWNTAYGWGNHSTVGYVTSLTLNQLVDVNAGGPSTGQVLKWSGTEWEASADLTASGGIGIGLSDLSVTINPSGINSLTYNNTTGVFLFTPTNLVGYATEGYVTTQIGLNTFTGAASTITSGQISNWNTAYGWGNHSTVGYASTSYVDSAVVGFITSGALVGFITSGALVGFITSGALVGFITSGALVGFITSGALVGYATEGYVTTQIGLNTFTGAASTITSGQISNWNTAYGWGDHSTVGYLTDVNITAGSNITVLETSEGNFIITSTSVAGAGTTWTTNAAGIHTTKNIGIGTALSSSALTVEGDGRFSGIITATSFQSSSTGTPTLSSPSTLVINAPTVAISTNLTVGGISTLGTVKISSGIITATTGIVTYYGDGSKLSGISASGSSQWTTVSSGITTTSNVGFGITNPTSKVHVSGDGRFTGVVTATAFSGSASALTNIPAGQLTGSLSNLNVSGLSTFAGITTVTGQTLFAKQLSVSGIITAVSFQSSSAGTPTIDSPNNLNINAVLVAISTDVTIGDELRVAGITTIGPGGIRVAGVVTATSFVGDGSALTGIVGGSSGIVIKDSGSTVGTAGTIDFGDNLSVSAISAGVVTVTGSAGGGSSQFVTTAAGIHTLSNVGIGTTNPTSALTVSGDVSTSSLRGYSSLVGTASSAITSFVVTVASKTSNHRYFGTGSGSAYFIDGIESPFLTLLPGKTYRFTQDDGSNGSHQLLFYYTADRTTQYTTNVTTNGSAGSAGAYTQIVVTDTTPVVLHYQCINHGYMGNAANFSSNVVDTPYQITARSGINVTGVVTATSFVGSLTGTATSTTNIPNLTGAITSVNTTTSLGSFTSANLATALTDETGSGSAVFATSPTFVTPALGTPSSGNLTNCTFPTLNQNTSGTASGLTGTPNITVGVATATSFRSNSTTGNGTDVGFAIKYFITASGLSAYRFAGPGVVNTTNNPTFYLHRGFTYIFENSTGGSHPFAIRYSSGGTGYGSTYLSGSQTGTQVFTVPFDAPATLVYQCTSHGGMLGTFNIVT